MCLHVCVLCVCMCACESQGMCVHLVNPQNYINDEKFSYSLILKTYDLLHHNVI